MAASARQKQELIVEAVRRGLDGERAVDFIRTSGFAMTTAGIARHLRALGGRGKIMELVEAGWSNLQILQRCLPEDEDLQKRSLPPNQPELFEAPDSRTIPLRRPRTVAFETTKITLSLPSELYQALRLAAHAERKPRNELIIELLTSALSELPRDLGELPEDGEQAH